jgi:DNA-binding XRE family transcriptional regulator
MPRNDISLVHVHSTDSSFARQRGTFGRGRFAMKAAATGKPAGAVSRAAIAGNLQLARTIFNFSQDDLGAQCQLHRTHISAIERQELNVGVDTIERIAKALTVPAYVLLMPRAEAQVLLYEAFVAGPGLQA